MGRHSFEWRQHKNENQPPDVGARGRTEWAGVRVRAGVGVPVRACRGVGMGAGVSLRVYLWVFVWVRGCPGVRAYGCWCLGVIFLLILLSDGKTPYERRFGMPFNGPVTPFGAMVEHHPISAKDQSRLHQFGAKVLPRKFLGYAFYAGRIWKGDITHRRH